MVPGEREMAAALLAEQTASATARLACLYSWESAERLLPPWWWTALGQNLVGRGNEMKKTGRVKRGRRAVERMEETSTKKRRSGEKIRFSWSKKRA